MLEKGNLENSYCKLENHAKGFARERRFITQNQTLMI
jgi:hypothetical protein